MDESERWKNGETAAKGYTGESISAASKNRIVAQDLTVTDRTNYDQYQQQKYR
ncbi:MAG: hypothetical protein AAGC78_08700 [Cellvibrio sp.]|uniref:hypothetical protein n=1 Tax=Cellvibrio sp. TaxID=1965322 RepID=UPI0031A74B3E